MNSLDAALALLCYVNNYVLSSLEFFCVYKMQFSIKCAMTELLTKREVCFLSCYNKFQQVAN